jgi:hypothetical protein
MSPDFNSGFFLTVTGIVVTFLTGALVYTIKSKCVKCSLCYGLISIERNVEVEAQEEQFEIEHGINPFRNNTEEKA